MRLWTLLAPLGSLPSSADAGATSRAWYEELRLAAVVAEGLRDRGLDEAGRVVGGRAGPDAAGAGAPVAVGGAARRDAALAPRRRVVRRPVVRSFLRVNRWDDAEWFHRESWAELLAWSDRLERALTPADDRVRRPVERSVLARRLAEAGEASGYQVEGLRAALDGPAKSPTAKPSAAAKPRLPRATGLPPGPRPATRARKDKPPSG